MRPVLSAFGLAGRGALSHGPKPTPHEPRKGDDDQPDDEQDGWRGPGRVAASRVEPVREHGERRRVRRHDQDASHAGTPFGLLHRTVASRKVDARMQEGAGVVRPVATLDSSSACCARPSVDESMKQAQLNQPCSVWDELAAARARLEARLATYRDDQGSSPGPSSDHERPLQVLPGGGQSTPRPQSRLRLLR